MLPLPVGPPLRSMLLGQQALRTPSSGKRRFQKARAEERWLERGILALSDMGGEGRCWNSSDVASGAQVAAVNTLALPWFGAQGCGEAGWTCGVEGAAR